MDPNFIEKAENYLYSKGLSPDMINIKDTLDDMGFLEIFIYSGNQKYVFKGISAKSYASNGKKWKELSDASTDWQEYLLSRALGEEKLGVLLAIRDGKFDEYQLALRDFLRNYNDHVFSYVGELGDVEINNEECLEIYNAHQELLDAEEKYFSYYLLTTKDDEEKIEDTIRRGQSNYAEFHTKKIKDFINHEVAVSVNEKGEEVYEFTQEQLAVFETLKALRETTDFAFRHQLYRSDQKHEMEEINK